MLLRPCSRFCVTVRIRLQAIFTYWWTTDRRSTLLSKIYYVYECTINLQGRKIIFSGKKKKNRLDYISLINLLKNLHLFRIKFRRINDVLVYNILNMWKMFSVFFSLNLNAVLNKKIWIFMNFIHSRNNLNKEDKYVRI